jgi:hypothetical protein
MPYSTAHRQHTDEVADTKGQRLERDLPSAVETLLAYQNREVVRQLGSGGDTHSAMR